jgi:hypothetical protein
MKRKNIKHLLAGIFASLLVVSSAGAAIKGDINGDGQIDLRDAIAALKVATGQGAGETINLSADVNGDGKVGMEEVVFILQYLGFIRTAPQINPIGDKTVDEGSTLAFSITATDQDGDVLTFSSSNLPRWATLDPATGAFSWTPSHSQSGTHQIVFEVQDSLGLSDTQTITVTVNDQELLFKTPDYLPLQVGNWWDYRSDATGEISQTAVTGTKTINSVETMVITYTEGSKEYYTSGSNGVVAYGAYVITEEYTGDVIFDQPLLLLFNNMPINSTINGSTSYPLTLYVPGYGYVSVTVDVTSRGSLQAIEDVVTENKILKDCFKGAIEFVHTVRGFAEPIISGTMYYWFYKDVGVVKQTVLGENFTITTSYVNGVRVDY